MATITRGATTLTPLDVLGWSLTRKGQTVVHPIIGDTDPDLTVRDAALRSGIVRTLWSTMAAALAASQALAVAGTPWTFTVPETPGLTMRAYVVGDVTEASLDERGTAWVVDVTVQETV